MAWAVVVVVAVVAVVVVVTAIMVWAALRYWPFYSCPAPTLSKTKFRK